MDPDLKRLEQLLALGRFAVTAFVTTILVCVFAWGFLIKNVDNQVFTQAVGMVLAFWFGASTARTGGGAMAAATTKTTETDPSGAKREVTMTASPGTTAPTPPVAAPLPKNGG